MNAQYDLAAITARLTAEDGGIDPDAWEEAAPDEPHSSERDDRCVQNAATSSEARIRSNPLPLSEHSPSPHSFIISG
ncbi:hypothetical protein BRD20_01880 [Halobacteriales archaeon SW_8_65_20]|nr:MAG: hypothetical protein BRD20_01880 [Halobacteriales archaeon SW_8_65_20]